jgi:hypothetical protein
MDVKYGAISILLTARFRNESIPLDTVYSKIECEKLHIKFCKRVLGIHQKSMPISKHLFNYLIVYWKATQFR